MLYDSIREAAIAALVEIMPKSKEEGHEYGGVVYREPDINGKPKYSVSHAVTNHDPAGVSIAPFVRTKSGIIPENIVASWHTHPWSRDGCWTEYFSTNDLSQLNVFEAIYIAALDTGNILERRQDNTINLGLIEFMNVMVGISRTRPPVEYARGDVIFTVKGK